MGYRCKEKLIFTANSFASFFFLATSNEIIAVVSWIQASREDILFTMKQNYSHIHLSHLAAVLLLKMVLFFPLLLLILRRYRISAKLAVITVVAMWENEPLIGSRCWQIRIHCKRTEFTWLAFFFLGCIVKQMNRCENTKPIMRSLLLRMWIMPGYGPQQMFFQQCVIVEKRDIMKSNYVECNRNGL